MWRRLNEKIETEIGAQSSESVKINVDPKNGHLSKFS